MSNYLLLTGATGLVGQYLLRDLTQAGIPLAVLIRSGKEASAQERLETVMAHWDRELGQALPRPVCLEGEITRVNLGLNPEAHHWAARNCSRVLHNAASLTFHGADRSRDPWLSNLTGTTNVLDLCRHLGIREFHYVSTAYVCGKREDTVSEDDLDRGQQFRNDYEECKFEAETRVRTASFLDPPTIYRPAIILGDSRTGYTSTYHGIYSYFQYVWILKQYARIEPDGRWNIPVRLSLTGSERRNLVPVDWVSAVMTHLFLHREHHGRAYHLTPPEPVTARELEDAISGYFRFYGPTFVGPEGITKDQLNDEERNFYDYVSRYEAYWAREPIFDCRHTLAAAPHLPCPPIDKPMMHRLLDFAVADRWGKRRGRGR